MVVGKFLQEISQNFFVLLPQIKIINNLIKPICMSVEERCIGAQYEIVCSFIVKDPFKNNKHKIDSLVFAKDHLHWIDEASFEIEKLSSQIQA